MWVVARVKKSEINIFKNKLSEKFDKDVKFYYPKVEHHRYIRNKLRKVENFILENYIFCFHHKFAEESCIPGIKFIKGLEYFLKGHFQTQEELKKFICHCKSFEDQKGYLTSGFFKTMIEKKAKFVSGPFTNMIFEVLERKKNKLKILIGSIVTTVSDNKNYLYIPV